MARELATTSACAENLQHIAQPVHVCIRNGIGLEKVVLHEYNAILGKRFGSFLGPDDLLRVLEAGAAILDDELELWIQSAQLNVEAT